MGALEKARNRSIDSLWEVNAKTIMALEATLGVAIGSDDGRVIYIQDTGVKEVGRGYIDRATKKVHICKERTEDVINTSTKFADHSIQSIYNKLENLTNRAYRDWSPSSSGDTTTSLREFILSLSFENVYNTYYVDGSIKSDIPEELKIGRFELTLWYWGRYGLKAICHNAMSTSVYVVCSWNRDGVFIWKKLA